MVSQINKGKRKERETDIDQNYEGQTFGRFQVWYAWFYDENQKAFDRKDIEQLTAIVRQHAPHVEIETTQG